MINTKITNFRHCPEVYENLINFLTRPVYKWGAKI